ncbi:acyl carrier protein [Asanoa iriomotensis]|uniref:Carrier domain-containing protein n=1 Tax=Asanoa iriomotensis TaxID=234613 RepID=A0ABQ4CH68_9ACTN|nr:acyl carrier protein [Asanoa iriomotensis]GIF61826.1 hypothetical protein Air01nite_79210 [Asanoa iriomotensis]
MSTTDTQADIRAALEACVRDIGRIAPTDTHFDQRSELFDTGYLDSLGIVALTAFVEQRFGVTLADDQLFDPRFTTIAGIADIIASHAATRPHTGSA